MCFSATASFVAGTALSAVGAATITKAKKTEVPFAAIPLFFGIQQFTEGLIWLSLRSDIFRLNTPATSIYSAFAYVFWPMFVPFAVRSLETVPWRKKALSLFQLVGVAVGIYLLYFHIKDPVTSQVINQCIVYANPHFDSIWLMAFYFTATCVSALFSSHKLVNVFGVLVIISALVSYRFYSVSFVSTWCYFAAVLSIVVYWYIKTQSLLPKDELTKIKA